jgi:thiol-disulfide isomerase/thioredoxin
MRQYFYIAVATILAVLISTGASAKDVDMAEVRELVKFSVDEILGNTSVLPITKDKYWDTIRTRQKPKVVFFYSNKDAPSRRVATLLRYVAMEYGDRISFRMVKVVEAGKPDPKLEKDLQARFSLDKTPGILFYDHVGDEMVLKDEDYIDPDFKEFRTPRMFLWKTYYSAVRKELAELLAD